MGYEGTWVVYLNNGLFCDFWKDGGNINHHHTLEDIIITIYNWRHSMIKKDSIDDKFVQELNKNVNNNPDIKNNIIKTMYKYYEDGGCMDKTREIFLPSKKIRENLTKIK